MLFKYLTVLSLSLAVLTQPALAQTVESGAAGAGTATAVAGGSIAALPTVVAATTVALAVAVATNKSTSGTDGTGGSR